MSSTELSLTSPDTELEVISEDNRPLSRADIARSCRSGNMVWETLPAPQGETKTGVFGLCDDIIVRFAYRRGLSSLAALRSLNQVELAQVPALAGAALTAATSKTRPAILGPMAIASMCDRTPTAREPNASPPNNDQRTAVANYLHALTRHAEPQPPNGTLATALFFRDLGEQLWRPETRRALTRLRGDTPVNNDFILLAGGYAEWSALTEVETCGVKLKLNPADATGAWPSLLIYETNGMTAEQARFLFSGRLPPILDCLAVEQPPLPAAELDLRRGIVTALLREASERAAFVPHGGFALSLPDGYPLRASGIDGWRVWAEPDGLWFLPISGGQIGAGYWWTPEMHRETLIAGQATRLSALLEVTAAALWRDLCVAGETVIRPRGGPQTAASRAVANPPRPTTRVLPARRIVLTGPREWSDASERALIAHRAHGVRGHLRVLHAGWAASAEALQVAEEFSMPIPDGYTFVRPHTRGERGNAVSQEDTIIKARGLATVMTLLQ